MEGQPFAKFSIFADFTIYHSSSSDFYIFMVSLAIYIYYKH